MVRPDETERVCPLLLITPPYRVGVPVKLPESRALATTPLPSTQLSPSRRPLSD